jgi:hypothetical protein
MLIEAQLDVGQMTAHVSNTNKDGISLPLPQSTGNYAIKNATPVANAVEKRSNDLLDSIKGMYRILDLITEQGSGGLGMTFSTCHFVLKLIII